MLCKMENITFNMDMDINGDGSGEYESNIDVSDIMSQLDNINFLSNTNNTDTDSETNTKDDKIFSEIKNYELNYTVKQLSFICEYYNLLKNIKINKLKKQDIIEQIILFEYSQENCEIVVKRKELWFYMNELKNDKIMKKYIIWI